jgi:hypothetical protein
LIGKITLFFTHVSQLTPAQLQDIATKLQALLGQLPTTQQTQLRAQLKKGLTKQEAIQILLSPR